MNLKLEIEIRESLTCLLKNITPGIIPSLLFCCLLGWFRVFVCCLVLYWSFPISIKACYSPIWKKSSSSQLFPPATAPFLCSILQCQFLSFKSLLSSFHIALYPRKSIKPFSILLNTMVKSWCHLTWFLGSTDKVDMLCFSIHLTLLGLQNIKLSSKLIGRLLCFSLFFLFCLIN